MEHQRRRWRGPRNTALANGLAVEELNRSFNTSNYSPPDAVDPAIGQMTAARLLGMTEPDRIGWLQQHMWLYVGRLLAATADGVRPRSNKIGSQMAPKIGPRSGERSSKSR